jgi:hypothetical protein
VYASLEAGPKICPQRGKTVHLVDEDEQEIERLALIYILYCSFPITVPELSIAVALTDNIKSYEKLKDAVLLGPLHDINNLLGPLIQAEGAVVFFIHSSIKDFPLIASNEKTPDANPIWPDLTKCLTNETVFSAPWCHIKQS